MSDDTGWASLAPNRIPGTLTWSGDVLRAAAGGDVLDIGCGPRPDVGDLGHFDGRRIGVDCNPAALRIARNSGVYSAVVCADGSVLPFANGTFDVILCKAALAVIVHDEACSAVFDEARRVLRAGGRMLISDFLINQDDAYFTDRYKAGLALGLPYGAFVAKDATGAAEFVARHFEKEWVIDQIDRRPELELGAYTQRPVRTRTGRPTTGFTVVVHRA